jgi:TRAP-type C4-dicarboxylate transport system permease small subunit
MTTNPSSPSSPAGSIGGMVVSGLIAAAIGLVVTFILSFVLPFPWNLGQTMLCVAFAAFSGSAVSFQRGLALGRSGR